MKDLTFKKSILGVLVLLVIVGGLLTPTERAKAIVPVADAAANIQLMSIAVSTGISAGVNTTATTWETIKENGLNFIAYQAAQVLMNQITDNIVNWIRGGFNGSPSFAIDPTRFFNDLADAVAGDLANYVRGLAVCDFDADFRISLMNSLFLVEDQNEEYTRKVVCPFNVVDVSSCDSNGNCRTISPAEQAQAFAQNFVNGGWNAYESVIRDGGNKFGVALVTQKELNRRTIKHQQLQEQKLTQSGGFLDILDTTDCRYPEGMDVSSMSGREKQANDRLYCTSTTPGALVSSQLSKVSGLDLDRLGFTDNFNKIASAFIQQVAKMAIEGVYKPRTDGGNGLTRARAQQPDGSYINFYDSCVAESESVVPTPDQEEEIIARAAAAPGVVNANTVYENARRDHDNAADALNIIEERIRIADQNFEASVTEASRLNGIFLTKKGEYDACLLRFTNAFTEAMECGDELTAKNTAERNYNIEKAKTTAPNGTLYLAQVASHEGEVEARRAESTTAAAESSARTTYENTRDRAYNNAFQIVMGQDVVSAGVDCVASSTQAISEDVGAYTQQSSDQLQQLYEDARAAEPIAI